VLNQDGFRIFDLTQEWNSLLLKVCAFPASRTLGGLSCNAATFDPKVFPVTVSAGKKVLKNPPPEQRPDGPREWSVLHRLKGATADMLLGFTSWASVP